MSLCTYDVLFIIIFFVFIYMFFFKNEGFQSTTTGYQADVEAIRNLSSIATQLTSNNTVTMPGKLNITGGLGVNEGIEVKNNTDVGGRLSIQNTLKDGKKDQTNNWTLWNMTGGYGNKLSFWRYNGDGANAGPALDIFDNGSSKMYGNLEVDGSIDVKGPSKIASGVEVIGTTDVGGRVSIRNTLKDGKKDQTNNWTLWNMTGAYGNKLSFWRYNGDGANAGPAVDINDDGTTKFYGSVKLRNGDWRGGATDVSVEEGGWGTWKPDYIMCPEGSYVCGLQTRFEGSQGNGDDTALNGIRMKCCKF